jgi:quinoprotein dehydrogenase-associated probable ABC transporter substrate-binding protein
MKRTARTLSWIALLVCVPVDQASAASAVLRVCSDPNNLPFSNNRGEGFENRLAEVVAGELRSELRYVWRPQRRGFLREGLNAGACDLVIGMPKADAVLATRPYYRSSYVFVSREDQGLDLRSLKDPRLRTLKVGVHLIGDDGWNVPPAHALAEQGIVANVIGYSLLGDYAEPDPPARLIEAVASGDVDVAIAWGPLAGYFARRSAVPLRIEPVADGAEFIPLVCEYPIGMAVRRDHAALRDRLDAIIERRQAEITAILARFGVPLVP